MAVVTRFRYASVLVWTSVAAVLPACADATGPSPTGPGGTSQIEASPSATTNARGDAAVWFLKPDQSLQRSSTKFTALVSRLGCNGGVTGQVLAPEIHMTESEVVVTFVVAAKQPSSAACPTNDQISYEVDLGEALQGRALVDGQCLPGREGATTSFCTPDFTRFRP
jgi:hypothetical protein